MVVLAWRADLGYGGQAQHQYRNDVLACIGGVDRWSSTDVLEGVQSTDARYGTYRSGARLAGPTTSGTPCILTLYFDAVDHAGHMGGPWSPGTRAAVIHIDSMIAMLVRGLEMRRLDQGVNLVIVSDHGMTTTSQQRTVAVADVIDVNTVLTADQGPYMWLQAKDGDQATLLASLQRLSHIRAYLRTESPTHLHVRHHPAHFAVLVLADDGWSIMKSRPSANTAGGGEPAGQHGYDPAYPSMWALFIAHGPSFKERTRLPVFDNVNIYVLLAHLLQVPPALNMGDLSVFAHVLKAR